MREGSPSGPQGLVGLSKGDEALILQVDAKRLTDRGVVENSIPRTLHLHFVMRWHERHACRVRDALPPVLSSMAVDFTILDVIDAG